MELENMTADAQLVRACNGHDNIVLVGAYLKIELKYGTSLIEIENKLEDGSTFEVETPNASLSVRGTTFEARYGENGEIIVDFLFKVIPSATLMEVETHESYEKKAHLVPDETGKYVLDYIE